MKVDVLVGLQRGDEGKGKIAKYLVETNDYRNVCRFNGGGNAGHTTKHNKQTVVTHYLTAGIYREGVNVILGPGCVVNIKELQEEIENLNKIFENICQRIYISENVHVITDTHLEEDSKNTIGTTGKGIGPCYETKCRRRDCLKYHEYFKEHITSSSYMSRYLKQDNFFPNTSINFEGRTLMEGAQGFYLDIDHGSYPFVTSSNCLPQHAFTTFGLPFSMLDTIFGVAKMYETYSGSNENLLQKFDPITEQEIREKGSEFGATTGRPRKIGLLNMDDLVKAIKMTGTNVLFMNKGDVLHNYSLISGNYRVSFSNLQKMEKYVVDVLRQTTNISKIYFSNTPDASDIKDIVWR